DAMQARAALRELITEHLKPLEKEFPLGSAKPLVMMIAGVNGAGKTTSIGKLANAFQERGAHVLLAAGDTFRAAAREQLMEWGSRNNVTVIAQEGGDPAAVAFDAVNAGRARKADVVMVDTAGRLPTQLHLMEELKKIRRVINKAEGSAPHEVLLVVDGNSGQNVLAQIRAFDAAIGLTGLVVTKLDGTAKGGILAAVAAGSQGVRPVPVYWIGVGEGIRDLQPFRAHEFAAALIGDSSAAGRATASGCYPRLADTVAAHSRNPRAVSPPGLASNSLLGPKPVMASAMLPEWSKTGTDNASMPGKGLPSACARPRLRTVSRWA